MDDTDRQLIGLLRENAGLGGIARQGAEGGPGTVQNRMAKLERDGTIAGYTIRLRPAVDERRISAFTTIAVEGARIEPVVRTLRGDPSVVTLYSTNGRWIWWRRIRADSLQSFDQA